MMRTIPRHIHAIWWQGWASLNPILSDKVKSVIEKNPNYQYIKWDEKSIREVMKDYPEYLKKLDSFELLHNKVDFSRFFLLWRFGGVSLDTDIVALKNLDEVPYIDSSDFIISKSTSAPFENLIAHGKREYFNNATILVSPQHPILKGLLDHILTLDCSVAKMGKYRCVQYLTGPEAFTDYVIKFKDTIKVLESSFLEPCAGTDNYCEIPENSVLDHQHEGSWIGGYRGIGEAYFTVKNIFKNYWWAIIIIILSIILLIRTKTSK